MAVLYTCDACASKLEIDRTGVVASQFIHTETQSIIKKGFRHPKKGQEMVMKMEQLFCPACTDKIKEAINGIARGAHFDAKEAYDKLEDKK